VPGLAPDTVASGARPSRKAELSHRLANGAGLSQFLQFRSAQNAYRAGGWQRFGALPPPRPDRPTNWGIRAVRIGCVRIVGSGITIVGSGRAISE
jgi:hypothetical protein